MAKRIHGEPGTLYQRCGGVFGVSHFVDRLMDRWMVDETLNANQLVARWHESAQRPGFKFLVVQIVCNLTGGPQQYTGRPMDEAHKHLNISEEEWGVFMEIFNDVCGEFRLAAEDIDDLNALMISMEEECVVYPGERPRRDPGPARPGGNSAYGRVGGVYPIALFADRLVDALIPDDRFKIMTDDKRNCSSLKYCFTEFMCNVCGGPEVVTARDEAITHLGVPRNAWPAVVLTARAAADHIENAQARNMMLDTLEKRGKEFVVDPNLGGGAPLVGLAARAAPVKSLKEAAAGKMVSKEEFEKQRATLLAGSADARRNAVAARRRVFGDPRTLYGRAGGVFGLARLCARLMDQWMADPKLNANTQVARWHESAQRCGFKFLVTQMMGYLCGGPQKYTGRPMDVSHKHLSITADEWRQFTRIADAEMKAAGVPRGAARELLEIIAGFEEQCTVAPGEAPWPEPGAPKAHASALGTSFHRLGGVYPLAQFADALVDAVVNPASGLNTPPLGDVKDPMAHRHAPGLKYVVTELICHACDGPELATVHGFDEGKLGVRADEWGKFLEVAKDTAKFFPTSHHRNLIMRALERIKADICVGLAADEEGDVDKFKDDGGADVPAAPAGGGKCPFGFGAGGNMPKPLADKDAQAAKTLADKGIELSMIAMMLKVDEASIDLAVHPEKYAAMMAGGGGGKPSATGVGMSSVAGGEQKRKSGAGKLVGDDLQKKLDALEEEDPDLCCPVTLGLFVDPVTAPDGFTYERESAQALTQKGGNFVSPMTRQAVPANFVDDPKSKQAALAWRAKRANELTQFAAAAFKAHPDMPHMATKALERVAEYMQALNASAAGAPLELSEAVQKQTTSLIKAAKTAVNPDGTWTPKPAALRALHALNLMCTGAGTEGGRKVTCIVCFDDFRVADGIECAGSPPEGAHGKRGPKHFLCDDCLQGHVRSCIDDDGLRLFADRGGVRCGDPTCKAPVFSDKGLAESLTEDDFKAYSVAKEKLAEIRITQQLEADFTKRMKGEMEKLRAAANNVGDQLRLHVIEKIFTLACPRCGTAFLDFNGCCALTCSKPGCGCGFCAYCLDDCGNDAHAHVTKCFRFGSRADMFGDFKTVQNNRRVMLFKALLTQLDPVVAAKLIEDCARDLKDLGMGSERDFQGIHGEKNASTQAAMKLSSAELEKVIKQKKIKPPVDLNDGKHGPIRGR